MSKEHDIFTKILEYKIIAISRGIKPYNILQTAKALFDGGIQLLEVAINQKNPEETFESIKILTTADLDNMAIGVGTVLSAEQVDRAYNVGATYIVTPSVDPMVIKKAKSLNMVVVCGALTPSEIVLAHNSGADFIKLFPTGTFGIDYVKAVRAPLNHIPMLAVGGIDEYNVQDYMDIGICGFGLSSNLVKPDLINNKKFDDITDNARKFVNAVKSASLQK